MKKAEWSSLLILFYFLRVTSCNFVAKNKKKKKPSCVFAAKMRIAPGFTGLLILIVIVGRQLLEFFLKTPGKIP